MYMDRMMEISSAENGFVVSCSVPLKPSKKKAGIEMPCCCDSYGKQYLAKDAAEVGALVAKLMPMLDMDYKSEDEFDAAFDKAAMEKKPDAKMSGKKMY